jgi:hypothetical protein
MNPGRHRFECTYCKQYNTQMMAQFIDNKNSQIADSFIINKGAAIIEDTNNRSEKC